ncbi:MULTISPECIES: PBECR4 domain-containing protein [Enterococcus]|uniref:PBECR4 domain-containing protein n=1 Tax=Enterococcus TaxID=1350 RepID=UPI001E55E750|nr:PBECR4 domain-containing protein [Enterococcus faecalis]MCD5030867.1 hypothetical protein [Enterococcus faecalis]
MKLPYKTWLESWLFFEKNFLNKRVIFEYKCGNKVKALEVSFKKQHFSHLCGITYTRGAKQFVDDLKKKKVSPRHVIFNGNKTKIAQKEYCLENISLLLTDQVRICERGNFANLQFDHSVRTNREIFALTCLYTDNGYSVPNSLIDLRTEKSNSKVFKKSFPVTTIYYIDRKTREKHIIF